MRLPVYTVMRFAVLPWVVALIATLSAALLVFSPAAEAATAGSGRAALEDRPVPAFEAISVAAGIDITVRQAASIDNTVRQAAREAVQVRADDNLLPLIETVVEAGPAGATLVVRFKRGESFRSRTKLAVAIDVVRLSALSLSGAGDVLVEALKTPALKLSVTGSGDATLRGLETDLFDARIVGSGDLRADGRARQVRLSMSGSGDATLTELLADDADLTITGSGDVEVHASKSLKLSVAGSGDVDYFGNPPSVTKSVAGSGDVTRR